MDGEKTEKRVAANQSVEANLRVNGCKGCWEKKHWMQAEEAAKSIFLYLALTLDASAQAQTCLCGCIACAYTHTHTPALGFTFIPRREGEEWGDTIPLTSVIQFFELLLYI